MAYQSLYRRYRSQRFSELRGQAHVTSALKAAIANGRHSHAYLFSGPRGTGKTSSARILAKALNCENVTEGEPCCECESCLAIEQGKSFDLYELDAASHNKVDDIRDLISKVHLGSPGRTKVYILDEVHMLSAGAENALLKTLEEPPPHVVFVLATTEPHKVVETIRSRTQHYEFHLLPADELSEHVRFVIGDAGLEVADDAIDYVLRQGGGSARDTLSALDLVAAAGGVPAGSDVGVTVTQAIGASDAQAAIAAVQDGLSHGMEPRVIGEKTVEVLRNAFLVSMGAGLDQLNDQAQQTATELASQVGPATLTRALERIGQALVEMRQAPDPRVPLEVTLLQLCRTGSSSADGIEGLQERVAVLEELVASLRQNGVAPASAAPATPAPTAEAQPVAAAAAPTARRATPQAEPAPLPPPTEEAAPTGPAAAARQTLKAKTGGNGASKKSAPVAAAAPTPPAAPEPDTASQAPVETAAESAEANATSPASAPAPEPATDNPAPTPEAPAPGADTANAGAPSGPLTAESATQAYTTALESVSQRVRVRFNGGQVTGVDGSNIVVAVPNSIHRDRCAEVKDQLEEVLSSSLGGAIGISVVVDDTAPPPGPSARSATQAKPAETIESIGPVDQLANATEESASGLDRITKAFPGSKVIDQEPSPG